MNTLTLRRRSPAPFAAGRRWLTALALGVVTLTTAFAKPAFSSLVVFGDSLCDRGNMYQLTGGVFPAAPAFFPGRQSNGPVWVEYLAWRLGLARDLQDYAVIGSTTGGDNVWSDRFPSIHVNVLGQVGRYLAEHGGTADPDALYIVQGGPNDLIALLTSPVPPSEDEVAAAALNLVQNVVGAVYTLYAHGARHIAVVNIPDIGRTPRVLSFEPFVPGVSAQVTGVCSVVNTYLGLGLAQLPFPVATIDAFGFIDDVALQPARYGFTNVTGAFMTFDHGTFEPVFAAPRRRAVEGWFFYDDLHPTTKGHAFFAEWALDDLIEAFDLPVRGRCGSAAGHSAGGHAHHGFGRN